jgi:hypothetical protein
VTQGSVGDKNGDSMEAFIECVDAKENVVEVVVNNELHQGFQVPENVGEEVSHYWCCSHQVRAEEDHHKSCAMSERLAEDSRTSMVCIAKKEGHDSRKKV